MEGLVFFRNRALRKKLSSPFPVSSFCSSKWPGQIWERRKVGVGSDWPINPTDWTPFGRGIFNKTVTLVQTQGRIGTRTRSDRGGVGANKKTKNPKPIGRLVREFRWDFVFLFPHPNEGTHWAFGPVRPVGFRPISKMCFFRIQTNATRRVFVANGINPGAAIYFPNLTCTFSSDNCCLLESGTKVCQSWPFFLQTRSKLKKRLLKNEGYRLDVQWAYKCPISRFFNSSPNNFILIDRVYYPSNGSNLQPDFVYRPPGPNTDQ